MCIRDRGGMMDINRMTAPLGYALGGPAGMVGRPTSAPESSEGYDPILGNWMKEARMRQAQPPAGAVDMTGQYVTPPERPRWEKARELYDNNEGEKYCFYVVVNPGEKSMESNKHTNPIKKWKDGDLIAKALQFKL